MKGKFRMAAENPGAATDWGTLSWHSTPGDTGAKHLAIVEVEIAPGGGHDFHKHPNQEELIYVVEGSVEQWLEDEMRVLGPGDSVFIGKDVVHASFRGARETGSARLLAILGPCVGADGYEVVEVADEAPWNGLRS